MTSRDGYDVVDTATLGDTPGVASLLFGAARRVALTVLAVMIYYALMLGTRMLVATIPNFGPWVDIAFGAGVRPSLLVLLLPMLTSAAAIACMALECAIGGWEKSTLKAVIEARSASVRMDFFYFLLRVSGGTALLALLFSLGTIYITTTTLNRALAFHLLDRLHFWPLEFLVLVFVNSLVFYLTHRLMHTRWFWEIHKVHHSAEDYNVLLPYRNHPIDYWIATIVSVAAGAILGGGGKEILAWLVLNTVYQSMVHSKVDWKWPWLEWIVITPAAHRVHHSMLPEHFNCNYGTLAIWDRLFGTYHPPEDVVRFGVSDREHFNSDNFANEVFGVVHRWIKSL